MDRLRSTSQRPKRSRLIGRALAFVSVAAALTTAGYFVLRPEPEPDPSSTTSSVITEASARADVSLLPPSSAGVTEAAAAPTRGGHATAGLVGELTTFNPLLTTADRSLAGLVHLTGAAAFRLDPRTHDLVPGVTTRVPDVASAGLTLNTDGTMTVRAEISADAYWSDGKKLTGPDFSHTYQLIEAHRESIHPDVLAAHDLIVPGSLVVSAGTIEYTLVSPTLALDDVFSVIVPAHAVPIETFTTDWNDEPWLSAGPFVVAEVDGNRVELQPNPEYRGTDPDGLPLPKLDGLTLVFHGTEADAVGAFGSGDADVVGTITSPTLTESLDSIEEATITVLRGPGWEHLSFQFGPGAISVNGASVVDRAIIRRAILAAIDRDAIATAVQGRYGEPVSSILSLGWPGAAEPIWETPEPRPGVLTGVTIVIATTGGSADRNAALGLVTEQLGAVGASVIIETDEAGRFFGDMVLPGQFEVAEWAWVAEPGPAGAADDLLSWFTESGSQQLDFGRWSTSEDAADFMVLMTGVETLLNVDDLEVRLVAAEKALYEQLPVIPLYADLNTGAAWNRVVGFEHSTLPGGVLATAAEWYLITE